MDTQLNQNDSDTTQAQTIPKSYSIVYEDDAILVIHKPTGVPSVPLKENEGGTAVEFALTRCPDMKSVTRVTADGKTKHLEPGLLHRLDTATSGLLVFAKTQSSFDALHKAWKNREVRKIYRAVVQSTQTPVPIPPLCLDIPLAHSQRSSKRMIALTADKTQAMRQIRGKPLPAVTHIRAVQVIESAPSGVTLADFEVEIETGVMHQIRCHLAEIGWSIVGDPIYKGAPSSRLWLHAWRITLPLEDKLLILEADLPLGWPVNPMRSQKSL